MKLIHPGDADWPPKEVNEAAKILTEWAALRGFTHWRIGGVASRRALEDAIIEAGLLEPHVIEAIKKAQTQ